MIGHPMVAAATVLAREISMGAAIASGGSVEAHETYGRNRPDPTPVSERGSADAPPSWEETG